MHIPDHIWTILLFASLVQGLFVAGVLLSSRRADNGDSSLLAVLCLVLVVMIGEELVDSANLYTALPHAALIAFPIPLAIGPLLVMCAQRLGDPARRVQRWELLQFLPLVAVAIYLTPFYALDGSSKLVALDGEMRERIDPLVLFKGLHVLGYQAAAIILCERTPAKADSGNRARILWFRRLLLFAFVPVVLVHVFYFFPHWGPVESDRAGSLVLAVLIYSFAYAAMKWPFFRSSNDHASGSERLGTARVKYRTSALDMERKNEIRDDLLAYMKREEPFRDSDSSLADVADALGVSTHELSQVLNDVLKVNFHTFLNGHRIDLVKEMMASPDHDHRNLLQLAFDAGFNSKTSFNRVFRDHVGTTPSEFRRRRLDEPGRSNPVTTAAVTDT